MCGECCHWPGCVHLVPDEINPIAAALQLPAQEFIAQYTTLGPDRHGLILTEKSDGACIFLEDNRCRIHPVKPRQCLDFPQRWNFEGFEWLCRTKRINAGNSQSPARPDTAPVQNGLGGSENLQTGNKL